MSTTRPKPQDLPDIAITGSLGFYQIRAVTPTGSKFLRNVQGFAHGATYSDDTNLTHDIADGACAKGLIVFVNGKEYTTDHARS